MTSVRFVEELAAYCRRHPKYAGLYIPGCNMITSHRLQAAWLISLAKRALLPLPDPRSMFARLGVAQVIIDGQTGGRHAAIWGPVACAIAESGHEVALLDAIGGGAASAFVATLPPVHASRMSLLPVFNSMNGWARRLRLRRGSRASGLPGGGVPRLVLGLLVRCIDSAFDTWQGALRATGVRILATTSPYSLNVSAMVAACRESGVVTAYLPQGLPFLVLQFPVCDLVAAWTPVSEAALRKLGWPNVIRSLSPLAAEDASRMAIRKGRRELLGIPADVPCVLFIGQKSSDQWVSCPGYHQTCVQVSEAVRQACRRMYLRVLVRPHPTEPTRETMDVFEASGLEGIIESPGGPLAADLMAADLVLSMHSAGLEEAYILRRPIAQVVAAGFDPIVDFRVLGSPLLRSVDEIVQYLEGKQWSPPPADIVGLPTPDSILLGLLGCG